MSQGTVEITIAGPIAHIELNQPKRRNALHWDMWVQLGECAKKVSDTPEVRAVIVSGRGDHFSSGMDLSMDNPAVQRLAPAMLAKDESLPLRELFRPRWHRQIVYQRLSLPLHSPHQLRLGHLHRPPT